MKPSVILAAAIAVLAIVFVLRIPSWTAPPIESTSYGPPEAEMVVFKDVRHPTPVPQQPEFAPAVAGGPSAAASYRDVQVLGGVSKAEFDRTMVAITRWVAPAQGCSFCHGGTAFNPANPDYASDWPRKEIARRMLAMTRTVNASWTNHVGAQGVTCFSCHAGRNVPVDTWHLDPPLNPPEGGILGKPQAWNTSAKTIARFFPSRPDRMFLLEGLPADQVQGREALAKSGTKASFQHDREYTEQVYIEMMQWSHQLGVNCTFCHQSRALSDWSQSPPMRLHGYSGLKMTVMMNQNFVSRLAQWTPAGQRGVMGDPAMVNCGSCHGGRQKPAGGMLGTVYPALIGPIPAAPANAVAAVNPGIPQLARAPRVGQPATETLVEYRGMPQRN